MFSAGHVVAGAVQHGDTRRQSGTLSLDGNTKILVVSTTSPCVDGDFQNPEHHCQLFFDVGFLGQGEDGCSHWMH